jgi:hypothetical protein
MQLLGTDHDGDPVAGPDHDNCRYRFGGGRSDSRMDAAGNARHARQPVATAEPLLTDGERNFIEQGASRASGDLYSTILSANDRFNLVATFRLRRRALYRQGRRSAAWRLQHHAAVDSLRPLLGAGLRCGGTDLDDPL